MLVIDTMFVYNFVDSDLGAVIYSKETGYKKKAIGF